MTAFGNGSLVELGPVRVDCLRVLLQIADLYRLVVVHLDEPPWLIRDFPMLLHTPEGGARARNTFASRRAVLS